MSGASSPTPSAAFTVPQKLSPNVGGHHQNQVVAAGKSSKTTSYFQMPLNYPRYKRRDYETMPEWKLDCLLNEYGLFINNIGDVSQKRNFAIGAFL